MRELLSLGFRLAERHDVSRETNVCKYFCNLVNTSTLFDCNGANIHGGKINE